MLDSVLLLLLLLLHLHLSLDFKVLTNLSKPRLQTVEIRELGEAAAHANGGSLVADETVAPRADARAEDRGGGRGGGGRVVVELVGDAAREDVRHGRCVDGCCLLEDASAAGAEVAAVLGEEDRDVGVGEGLELERERKRRKQVSKASICLAPKLPQVERGKFCVF